MNRSIILVLLLLAAAILASLPNALSAIPVRVVIEDSEFAEDYAISRETAVTRVQDDNVLTVINGNGISTTDILRQRDSLDYRYNEDEIYRNYYRSSPSRVETVIVTENPTRILTGTSGRYARVSTGTSGGYARVSTGTSRGYARVSTGTSGGYARVSTGISGRYARVSTGISGRYTGIATGTSGRDTETIDDISELRIPTIVVPPISTLTAR